jgi:hypothetical protein
MFAFFKRKDAEVLSHWYAPVANFRTSSHDFYAEIEKELAVRQVPGLEMSRIEFAEGGLLSAKRVYLRMLRERLVFDICAAPFGTAYFFSLRFAELPVIIKPWELLVFLGGLFVFLMLFVKASGLFLGPVLLLVTLGFCGWLMRNAIALGLSDLDASLIKTPVIGPLYEVFLRKKTYYRQDTRLMYLSTVDAVVREKVEEVTAAKGVKLVRINEHSPVLRDLYKPTLLRAEDKGGVR